MSTTAVIDDERAWKESYRLLSSNTIHRVTHIGVLCAIFQTVILRATTVLQTEIDQVIDQMIGSWSSIDSSTIFIGIATGLCLSLPLWPVLAAISAKLLGADWKNVVYNFYYGLLATFTLLMGSFYFDVIFDFDYLFRLSEISTINRIMAGYVCLVISALIGITIASVLPSKLQVISIRYLPKSPSILLLLFSFLPGIILAGMVVSIQNLNFIHQDVLTLNLLGTLIVPAVAWIHSRHYEMAIMCFMNYLGIGGAALWVAVWFEI